VCLLVVNVVALPIVSGCSLLPVLAVAHLLPVCHFDLLVERMVADGSICSSALERLECVSCFGSGGMLAVAAYAAHSGSLLQHEC
jgi:hypothetical protein